MENTNDQPQTPTVKQNVESLMAKNAKRKSSTKPPINLEGYAKLAEKIGAKITIPSPSMSDRYKKSWNVMFDKQPSWRQQEILRSIKQNGKLSEKQYDTDFVKDIIKLAESDDPLTE